LSKADPILGVDMSSTGEVGCIGDDFYEAVLKAMLSVGYTIPKKNILLSTGPMRSKVELLNSCRLLAEKGYNLFGTQGTAQFLQMNGIECTVLAWPGEDKKPNTLDYLRGKLIDLVINIPKDLTSTELSNDYTIRRSAVDFNIPLITNGRLASAFLTGICKLSIEDIQAKSWDEYKIDGQIF
jgi:carbamoyl-phosphate synthase large subunit